jgi:hypothetical protein
MIERDVEELIVVAEFISALQDGQRFDWTTIN